MAKLFCLTLESHKLPQLAARLWSEANHVIGQSASHNSVECKDVSLDNLNNFF